MRKLIIFLLFPITCLGQVLTPKNMTMPSYKYVFATPVQTADSVQIAIAKLQAQINQITGRAYSYRGIGAWATLQNNAPNNQIANLYQSYLNTDGTVKANVGFIDNNQNFWIYSVNPFRISAPSTILNTMPTTSAGGYNFLTINSSTNVIEKLTSLPYLPYVAGTPTLINSAVNSNFRFVTTGGVNQLANVNNAQSAYQDFALGNNRITVNETTGVVTAPKIQSNQVPSAGDDLVNKTALDAKVSSGTYTPTITNVTNVTSSGAIICNYTRVGDVVTVNGSVTITPTSTGISTIRLTLPIASNIGATTDLSGVGGFYNDTVNVTLQGDATNNAAELRFFIPTTAAGQTAFFNFAYQVI